MNQNPNFPLLPPPPQQQQQQYSDISLADQIKKEAGMQRMSTDQQYTLYAVKGCCAACFCCTGTIALALVLFISATFGFFMVATTDYRTGAALSSVDGYPEVVTTVLSPANVALIAAFVTVMAFIGLLINLCFQGAEVEQLSRGANPYFWFFATLFVPVSYLLFAFLAGISNIWLLAAVMAIPLLAQWIAWGDDLLHSYAYSYASSLAQRMTGETSWSWLPFVFWLIGIIIVDVIILVYLGFTFSSTPAPSGWLISIPVAGMIFYFGFPIIVALFTNRTLIMSIYVREIALYLYSGFYVLLVTWLSLIIFATVVNV